MRLIILFLVISTLAFSQQANQRIAQQYYINGEYDKAIVLYKELVEKQFSVSYYVPYYMSLLKTENYKQAEYLAQKLVRKYPNQLHYKLGVIIAQDKSGKHAKSEIAFAKLLNKINLRLRSN